MPNVRIAPRRYTRRRRARRTPALLLVCALVALVAVASAVALCHAHTSRFGKLFGIG